MAGQPASVLANQRQANRERSGSAVANDQRAVQSCIIQRRAFRRHGRLLGAEDYHPFRFFFETFLTPERVPLAGCATKLSATSAEEMRACCATRHWLARFAGLTNPRTSESQQTLFVRLSPRPSRRRASVAGLELRPRPRAAKYCRPARSCPTAPACAYRAPSRTDS